MSINYKSIGRNEPCPCGSGKKYKQCCQNKDTSNSEAAKNRLLESIPDLFKIAYKHQHETNDLEKAEQFYQKVLNINPKHIDSLNNLGLIFFKTDRLNQAKEVFSKVVKLRPTAESYNNLAQTLPEEEAIDCLKQAIKLNPGDVTAYNSLGAFFARVHRTSEAITCYQKCISLSPKYTLAYNNLAGCYMNQAKYIEAAKYYEYSITIDPTDDRVRKDLLFCLCFNANAFPQKYLQTANQLDTLWQKIATPYKFWQCNNINSTPLKIGLVSGDIGNHPVGYFLENIVKTIDGKKIELYVYSTRASFDEDELTNRLKPYFKCWHNIRSLNDKQAAELIYNDNIHILIDLAGYTANSGISIFSWKPAPIQVSWLGYFASTGLSCIDYFIADPISVPIDKQNYFTEQVYYLSDTRLCFSPPSNDLFQALQEPPALQNNYITFGCFQNLSKLNDNMLKNWSIILKQCNNSKLLIKNKQLDDKIIHHDLLEKLKSFGFNLNHIILEGSSSRSDYFACYNKVDIMLDTFPYPGGTTTCEALWMGVPTITLAGNTLLERQGMSMLNCVGLTDWISHSEEEYINLAIFHTKNTPHLKQLKFSLRNKMLQSPLANAKLFTHNLENAFLDMWQTYTSSK